MADEASKGPAMEEKETGLTSSDGEGTEKAAKQESREEMLARHRKEIKALQGKEVELKKNAAKGSKAQQKTAKKAVDEQIAKLDAAMKKRHLKELAASGFVAEGGAEAGPAKEKNEVAMEQLVNAVAGVGVSRAPRGPSKAQMKKDAKMRQALEREQRIEAEKSGLVSERVVENEALQAKLAPLGFTLREIKPDGHCLYRAVEDQLQIYGKGQPHDFAELRKMAADYMRSHREDFIPFVAAQQSGEDGEVALDFDEYCNEVESTAAWGGQLELGALSHVLKKHICVYSADLPVVEMGKEYGVPGGNAAEGSGLVLSPSFGAGLPNGPLRVSYHRHAYGLGEHYNSVIPSGATGNIEVDHGSG